MSGIRRLALFVLAALGLASAVPAHADTTLRVVMHSDLKFIDPIWTTALISADHGYLVYDTLFALDESLTVKPQMVDKWTTSPDNLVWTFTLREGLAWHDGQPVTAADCVASIRRWGARLGCLEEIADRLELERQPVPGELRLDDRRAPAGAAVKFVRHSFCSS